jgi:hypothetical protein
LPRIRPRASSASAFGVALAGEQRVQHRASRDAQDVAGEGGELDQRVLEQLLEPLQLPPAVGDQVDPQPPVVAQPPDLGRRNERGSQHPALVELREPDRVQLVGLGAPRHLLDVARVDQPYRQPLCFEQVHERAPVVRGRFDHDPLDSGEPLERRSPAGLVVCGRDAGR